MTSGTYLGFDFSLSFVYFGLGFACCVWSLWIFTKRLATREAPQEQVEEAQQRADSEENTGAEHAA